MSGRWLEAGALIKGTNQRNGKSGREVRTQTKFVYFIICLALVLNTIFKLNSISSQEDKFYI